MTILMTSCLVCKHWWGTGRGCDAFPDGVPAEIRTGKVAHIEPRNGDHGIQFESIDVVQERLPGEEA